MDQKEKTPFVKFVVGDRSFRSDVSAFQYFTNNLKNELRMDFGFKLSADWSQQPVHSVEHYRQQMCAYIENNYHNIVIAYSGGTDSETMVDAFKRRGTKQIILMHLTNCADAKTKSRKWLEKHMEQKIRIKHADAVKYLGWKINVGTLWQPGDSSQQERTVSDNRFTSWGADVAFINQWYEDKPNQKILDLHDPRKKTCVIYGKEKPEIGIEDGWWVARYVSSMFERTFNFDHETDDIFFFLNGQVSELAVKIAWLKALEMQKIFVSDNILPTEANANSTSLSSSPYYTRLVKAMGYEALSDFLNSASTKNWGWWKKKALKETTKISKETKYKQIIQSRYFDEVLTNTIDNRFLDLEAKMVHGIRSKSYRLFPVNDVLTNRLSEHLKNADIKKNIQQPWEKSSQLLTNNQE